MTPTTVTVTRVDYNGQIKTVREQIQQLIEFAKENFGMECVAERAALEKPSEGKTLTNYADHLSQLLDCRDALANNIHQEAAHTVDYFKRMCDRTSKFVMPKVKASQ